MLLEPVDTVPPFQVPCEVGVRSNAMAKNTPNVLDEPQNPPPVVFPVTMLPLKLTEPLRLPVAIRLVLMSSRALVLDGYVRRARAGRAGAVSSTVVECLASRVL